MKSLSRAAGGRNALIAASNKSKKLNSDAIISLEKKSSANNYAPVPVVFSSADGVKVKDPSGKVFLDFLSAYGAVNQGHHNRRIIHAAKQQLSKVSLASRAFHCDNFGVYAQFITKFFGYDRVLPMNTGAEGVETAIKLSRKWGYKVKGIAPGKAQIVCCTGCFHGRTLGAISMSDDQEAYSGYEPLVRGFTRVPYGDIDALKQAFAANHKNICAFVAEPIQGEAGVVIPPAGYFKEVRALCTKYNILFVADEVQSGLGRSGKMLAIEHDGVRPDVIILAKALGGGVMPVSAVLADAPVMDVFTPGTHGSTFGGNPVANAVAIESLKVLHECKLPERSRVMGARLLAGLQKIKSQSSVIAAVRGRGLFAAIDVEKFVLGGQGAYKLMKLLAANGLLCKTTHGYTLRLSPPLTISEKLLDEGLAIIAKSVAELENLAMGASLNIATQTSKVKKTKKVKKVKKFKKVKKAKRSKKVKRSKKGKKAARK